MKKFASLIVALLMSVSVAFAAQGDIKTNTAVIKAPVQEQVTSVKKVAKKKVKKKVKKEVKPAVKAEVTPVVPAGK